MEVVPRLAIHLQEHHADSDADADADADDLY